MTFQAIPRDSLARVVEDVLSAPAYDWDQRRSAADWLRSLLGWLIGWLDRFASDHPVGFIVFMLALTALLLALLVHMAWLLHRALNPSRRAAPLAPHSDTAVRTAAWHLGEARRAAQEGRFRDALAHRFLALVLDLDRRREVQAHPAKTPAEYAREARMPPERRRALERLVVVLYQHLYGGRPADPDDWRRFDGAAAALASGHATV